jgi:site-specific DNA recombinase
VAPGEWISVPVPPLVEEELFEAAREQLAENRRRNRQHAHGQRYLLQGLIVCQQCGYAYYGKAISLRSAKGKRRAYAYYRCCGSDAYRFGGERLCANPQVRTDRLDEAVWREVERVLQDPSWIAAEYERRLDQARDPTTVNLAGIEAQIAKLRRGMGRLIDGYAEGLIDKADFEPRVAGLRQRIKSWEEQATTLRDEVAQRAALSLVVGRLQDFVRQVRDRMSAVDWSLQRDLIRLLVKRVEIDRGDINVVFRVAPSFDPGYGGSQDDRSLHHRGRSERTALRDSLPTCLEEPVVEHAHRQVGPDEPEQPPIRDARRHRGDQPVVVDPVEELGQVDVHDKLIACDDIGLRLRHRLVGGAARPEAVAVLAERRVPQRLELLENRLLDHAINRGWNAKVARPAGRLRDGHPTHRLRLVAPLAQLSFDFRPARLENSRQLFDGDPINARRSLVAHHRTQSRF